MSKVKLKQLFIIFLVIFSALAAQGDEDVSFDVPQPPPPEMRELKSLLKPSMLLKAKITHIFQDENNKTQGNKLLKIQLGSENSNKELVVLEDDFPSLMIGDKILIAKMEAEHTFGMGEDFEYQLKFVDLARDQYIYLLFLPIILLLLFINKKAAPVVLLVAGNLFLLFAVLPWLLKIQLGRYIFILLFLGLNHLGFQKLFKLEKYMLALMTALPVSVGISFIYSKFMALMRLDEYTFIAKNFILPTTRSIAGLDFISMLTISFFIYLYSSLFFIRQSYRKNIYTNFSQATWQLTLLYLFLIGGLLLPTFMYFNANNLTLFHVFNYQPFVLIFIKLMFLYWGNVFCGLFYLTAFYIRHRKNFQKQLLRENLPERKNGQLDLIDLITERRAEKYNEKLPGLRNSGRAKRKK